VGSGGKLPPLASAQSRSARLYSSTPDGAFRSQHFLVATIRWAQFAVTAVDADDQAIAVARAHADATGLSIDYRIATAESLACAGQRFDAVLALEIIEHVADPAVFLGSIGGLVRQGGVFIGATLNRTPRSLAAAIIGAEYLLGWLPRGTHDWRKFLRPSELVLGLRRNGLNPTKMTGISYDWIRGKWSLSRDLDINYMVTAVRW